MNNKKELKTTSLPSENSQIRPKNKINITKTIPYIFFIIITFIFAGTYFLFWDSFLEYEKNEEILHKIHKRCEVFIGKAMEINIYTDYGDYSFEEYVNNICDEIKKDGGYCEEECIDKYYGDIIG